MRAAEVRKIREKLGRTQDELAKLIGVHSMTVSKWERGTVKVPKPIALLLRLLLQVKQDKTPAEN